MTFFILGIVLYLAAIGAMIIFSAFQLYSALIAHRRGAIFVPSTRRRVATMLELAVLQPGEHILDLGSGDGRIVMGAAERGARAVGLEINPFLVWYARMRIRRAGLAEYASILRQDFNSYPFSHADVVFLYLRPAAITNLKHKFLRELKPETRIISNAFSVPGWKPVREKNSVFLYKRPS